MSNSITHIRRGLTLGLIVVFVATSVMFVPAALAGGHRDDGPQLDGGDTDGVGGNKLRYQIDPQGGGGDWVDRSYLPGGGGDPTPPTKTRFIWLWYQALDSFARLMRR